MEFLYLSYMKITNTPTQSTYFYLSHRTWTYADPEIVNEWSTGGFYLPGKVQSLFYYISLISHIFLGGVEPPSPLELHMET